MRAFLTTTILFSMVITARATTPVLTSVPQPATAEACAKWATQQDEDAIYMWGQQESGGTSPHLAIERLKRSCLGKRPPKIVYLGSSIGYDMDYCRAHRSAKICRGIPSR